MKLTHRPETRSGTLVGLVIGLILGVLLAVLVVPARQESSLVGGAGGHLGGASRSGDGQADSSDAIAIDPATRARGTWSPP